VVVVWMTASVHPLLGPVARLRLRLGSGGGLGQHPEHAECPARRVDEAVRAPSELIGACRVDATPKRARGGRPSGGSGWGDMEGGKDNERRGVGRKNKGGVGGGLEGWGGGGWIRNKKGGWEGIK